MAGMLVEAGMELWLMVRVGIQPRKKLTCQFSQNGANQKRWSHVEIQPSAAVLMSSMLQRVPSKKAVWSIKPVKTQGSVAVGTATQWRLVQHLLGVRQECVSKPCLAAAMMEKHPHPLFQRLKDEGEGKQRSLETGRLKPLVIKLPKMTVELREKAKRAVMALEMLQRKKKKERMKQSVKRTRSAKTGNLVVVRTGAPTPRDRKSKAASSVLRKYSCVTNARKLCMVAVLIYKMLQQALSLLDALMRMGSFMKTVPSLSMAVAQMD